MSFILDQLKKSGKKRELELAMRSKAGDQGREAADAPVTGPRPEAGKGIHLRGIHLMLFLAVASLSALGGFMLFKGKTGSPQAPVVAKETLPHVSAVPAPKAENSDPKSALPVEGASSVQPKQPDRSDRKKALTAPAVVKEIPVKKVRTSIPQGAATGHRNNQGAADQREAVAVSPAERSGQVDDSSRTPYLNELPASMRKTLPPLRITSHLYRGKSRLVSINGRIMSEGVSMDDGLFLEEITQEGVILSFRGHRFRVRAD